MPAHSLVDDLPANTELGSRSHNRIAHLPFQFRYQGDRPGKDTQKSVFEHVVYDSGGVERTFAEQMEKSDAVKVYAKLPGWFKVPTPLGTYNPDWAVLVQTDGQERLYFVVETKGSLFTDDLRDHEAAKIACGEAHFKSLAVDKSPARYVKATKLDDVLKHC